MATTLRALPTRNLLLLGRHPKPRLPTPPSQQRRWAQVHDVRFLATTLPPRNIAEKYREKLDRKAREEGHRDIGGLKAAYADKIEDLKRRDSASVPGLDALLAADAATAPAPPTQQQTPAQTSEDGITQKPPPPPQAQPAPGGVKPLSAILDLPKARALPLEELSAVWRLRHASSPTSLCAAIPHPTYATLTATARRHPTFVLPVPREGAGAEIHFLQWTFDDDAGGGTGTTATVLFTQLAEYKARGEWAQPHTSLTHYADDGLAGALMLGQLVEGRGASLADARFLVMLMQRFYGAGAADPGKRSLLEEFGRGGEGFSVERLLEESERLG
ncbi:ATP11-domain-containing protein [Xylariomycetidae sp. FL2044]|nr:ATP11-domain-containing protein [Xylariomycetidae sp. FL2044]